MSPEALLDVFQESVVSQWKDSGVLDVPIYTEWVLCVFCLVSLCVCWCSRFLALKLVMF